MGPHGPCHRTTIGKGALGPLKALKGFQEDSEIRELNFLPRLPWAPAASSAEVVQASVTLDSWAPDLLPVSSYPKLPQVPFQTGMGVHEVPTLVPRHAGCLSPLNPNTSSRSPRGLGCSSQTTAVISYPQTVSVSSYQDYLWNAHFRFSPFAQRSPAPAPSISCLISPRLLLPFSHPFPTCSQAEVSLRKPRPLLSSASLNGSTCPQDKSQTPVCGLQGRVYHSCLAPDCTPGHHHRRNSPLQPPGVFNSRPLH